MQTCAAGRHACAVVSNEKEVWVKGTNYQSQLGLSDSIFVPTTKLDFPQPIISVCVGSYKSLFLGENGDVWTCGKSIQGVDKIPRLIANLPPIQAISCSSKPMADESWRYLLLDFRGNVWKCFSTRVKYQNRPRKIGKGRLPPIKSLCAATRFSLFLDHEGNVWSQGHSTKGCLGFNNTQFQRYPTKIPNLCGIVEISCSDKSSLFLDENGVVWACGRDKYQDSSNLQSEIPCIMEDLPQITAISAGERHWLFLDTEHRVWGLGMNKTRVMGSTLDSTGCKVFYVQKPKLIEGLGEIIGIKAGHPSSLYIDSAGCVWAAGENYSGSLSDKRNYVENPYRDPREYLLRKPTKLDFPPILIEQSNQLKSARNT